MRGPTAPPIAGVFPTSQQGRKGGLILSIMGRDPFQMIATVGDTITHVYGPGDHRIWQVDHTTSTWDESWTIRDLSGNVVRRLDKVGPTWSFGQNWIRRDGSLLAAALPGGLERHYHLDHLGSARLITQQTGTTIGRFAYLPFGEDASEVSATFPETMRFTGHERDGVETAGWAEDLDNMRARYCSPRWGRFLSVDPARESARVGVPQSWNRYSYVMNRPLTHIDPDGEEGVGIIQDLDNKALLSGEMSREEYLERAGARAQGALAGALFLVPGPEDFLVAAAVGRLFRGAGRSARRVASSRDAAQKSADLFGDGATVVPRQTRSGGTGVRVTRPDGSVIDITEDRVKEFIPNTHPDAPPGTLQRVKFPDSQPGSKGFKRDPSPEELEYLSSLEE